MAIPNVNTDGQGNHFQTIRAVYRNLSRPEVTNHDRERLRNVILEARINKLSYDEVQNRIAREVPVFSNFFGDAMTWSANSHQMKAAANWSQVLGFVVAVIALIYTFRNSSSSPSPREMEEAFRRALLQTQQSAPANIQPPMMPAPKAASVKPLARIKKYANANNKNHPKNKIGRGTFCPCGSLKTYSKCCGRQSKSKSNERVE